MLQRITDMYQPAIQVAKGIILILDLDGKMISFNQFMESATGYSQREMAHKNWFDLFLPAEEKAAARRYFRRYILRDSTRTKIVMRIITRTGAERFIEWHYKRLTDDTTHAVIGVLAIGQEVTERVLHERQLLDERTQLIERNKELTCLYEIATIVGQNRPLPQMLESIAAIIPPAFQYPSITAATINLDQHSYGDRAPALPDLTLREELTIQGIRRGNIEVTCLPPKNGPKTMKTPFLDEERALMRTLAHHLSLAIEKKEALDKQAEIEGQLRHADRLAKIGQLTAGVAHELNEPLGNILGFSQLSLKTGSLPEQVYKDLENIVKATLHAREIIKKLMLFSRQTPPQETQVDLNRLVEDVSYLFESRCAKNGITMLKSLGRNLPTIKADPSQLQQVLTNLIVNAFQALPDGGELRLETLADTDYVYLLVQDSGIGMTPETLKQIFLPFFTTKDVKQGTGLGLSVVHGIVKAHGGSIDVESRIGRGSCFRIKFPLNRVLSEEKHGS